MQRRDCDVLVVGSGIAGLTLALSLAGHARAAVVTKKARADELDPECAGISLRRTALGIHLLQILTTRRSRGNFPLMSQRNHSAEYRYYYATRATGRWRRSVRI